MMSGKERREEILQRITNSKTPVSGAALAKSCEVSRQVIVQDIALIRAAGYDVIATNRSEERRVGKECLRLCRSRWSPYH